LVKLAAKALTLRLQLPAVEFGSGKVTVVKPLPATAGAEVGLVALKVTVAGATVTEKLTDVVTSMAL
jgi:hypothetical protein